ncbi:MAG: GTPase, partial [Planctomycetota bacterium]|nr:GTPase [Planctomycetota bacterium]
LLFVVDARDGMTPLDETISKRLRATDKPILLVANKCDADKYDIASEEFSRFGYGVPVKVSAANRLGRDDLLEAVVQRLPDVVPDSVELSEPEMKIAIVGRRNVGKSTFINTLTNSDRMIVSEVAGTTRDSVNVRFEMDDKAFVAIDTPGLRKNKSVRTTSIGTGLIAPRGAFGMRMSCSCSLTPVNASPKSISSCCRTSKSISNRASWW